MADGVAYTSVLSNTVHSEELSRLATGDDVAVIKNDDERSARVEVILEGLRGKAESIASVRDQTDDSARKRVARPSADPATQRRRKHPAHSPTRGRSQKA